MKKQKDINPKDMFKAVREKLGKSQAEFGKMFGKTHWCISDYETGRTFPRADLFLQVKKIYDRICT
jgi:DNA-binding transcriptional regulator YiaG